MEIVPPKVITYKEIMIVYGFNVRRAQDKVSVIRSILGKKRKQAILIAEFCEVENVKREIFEHDLKAAYLQFHQKPQNQQRLFT